MEPPSNRCMGPRAGVQPRGRRDAEQRGGAKGTGRRRTRRHCDAVAAGLGLRSVRASLDRAGESRYGAGSRPAMKDYHLDAVSPAGKTPQTPNRCGQSGLAEAKLEDRIVRPTISSCSCRRGPLRFVLDKSAAPNAAFLAWMPRIIYLGNDSTRRRRHDPDPVRRQTALHRLLRQRVSAIILQRREAIVTSVSIADTLPTPETSPSISRPGWA